jgi:hypothetical protein
MFSQWPPLQASVLSLALCTQVCIYLDPLLLLLLLLLLLPLWCAASYLYVPSTSCPVRPSDRSLSFFLSCCKSSGIPTASHRDTILLYKYELIFIYTLRLFIV